MGLPPANPKETRLPMPDLRKIVNAQMAALIDGTFGCLDAAAETINARTGGSVSKGTLSKRLSGQLGWTIEDVAALQMAAGQYPVTRTMMRLEMDNGGKSAAACLYAASGVVSKEVGEAVSAALRAAQSADGGDIAEAIREAVEAEEAMRRLREALEARA
ncbi:hypothetical protein [Pseudosulfitobacter pseudonitzschiae]|uniref:hypothetical protein n=2 Tax=Pseudosulfitobacter pseudonitzschiae TaxID=1402135 RepID=UPI001E2D5B89|nr:hypothetical protein [Pseudosulfitobacter pseudonitzschiae]UFE28310.1 hypothetical protein LOE41_16955 [Pseudosulfitobacter pseudonitzschiae]UFE45539.1 hypothetical protein LOE37_10285 [Pseudosulfitobacter pseudonitzschiae]UFE91656.1 hypothetical protein LOE23_08975 [Pseudosulfitobacter pseudonitzschiae]UFF25306.1 hypothetical protein LOE17_10255 [Pseudosulfitobacter pseudonitzschiae]